MLADDLLPGFQQPYLHTVSIPTNPQRIQKMVLSFISQAQKKQGTSALLYNENYNLLPSSLSSSGITKKALLLRAHKAICALLFQSIKHPG